MKKKKYATWLSNKNILREKENFHKSGTWANPSVKSLNKGDSENGILFKQNHKKYMIPFLERMEWDKKSEISIGVILYLGI